MLTFRKKFGFKSNENRSSEETKFHTTALWSSYHETLFSLLRLFSISIVFFERRQVLRSL